MSSKTEPFDYNTWLAETGLSQAAVQILLDQNIVSLDALIPIDESDIQSLKFKLLGDKNILRAAIKRLKSKYPSEAPSVPGPAEASTSSSTKGSPSSEAADDSTSSATPASLAQLKDLTELAQKLGIPFGDLLSSSSPQSMLAPGLKGEKAHRVVDFVRVPHQTAAFAGEEVVSERGDSELVWRNKAKKPTLEKVSVAQWAGASFRIARLMLDKLSKDEFRNYLDYHANISDFMQIYTVPSVLMLDDAHRGNMVSASTPWTALDHNLETWHLVKRGPTPPAIPRSVGSSSSKGQGRAEQADEFCYKFNFNSNGCSYKGCVRKHACAICQGAHPQRVHDTVPPRFRGSATSTTAGAGSTAFSSA